MRFQAMKKISVLLVCSLLVPTLYAQDALLQQIANNTGASATEKTQVANNTALGNILQAINQIPPMIAVIASMATSWLKEDKSDATSVMQGNFTQIANLLNQNLATQKTLQVQIDKDLLSLPDPNSARTTLPYANDLLYSTLLGEPYFPKDPRATTPNAVVNAPYNYLKNAAGINISHTIPALSGWQGSHDDYQAYQNYYNTVTAVQSYNGYILSSQYADGNQFNDLQTKLINQASDPQKWFAQVAGAEDLGVIFKQLLLYQSQLYVLMTQLIQTQKQMATAQAMTNTLLIINNHTNEGYILAKAQGTTPR